MDWVVVWIGVGQLDGLFISAKIWYENVLSRSAMLSSKNKVILAQVSSCRKTGSIRRWSLLDLLEEQFRTDRAIQCK